MIAARPMELAAHRADQDEKVTIPLGQFGLGKSTVLFGVCSMEAVDSDKRRHERHPVSVCAWLEFQGDTSAQGMRSVDLSVEGARFSSVRAVQEDEPVILRLQLHPSAHAIECKGRIRWARAMENRLYHFGVRFVDLCEDECHELNRILTDAVDRRVLAVI